MNTPYPRYPQLLVTTILLSLSASANANIEKHCELYANKAVEQQQRNLDNQCNLTGSRWSSDKEGQYQWCLTVNPQLTNNENAAREKMLQACLQRQQQNRISIARASEPASADKSRADESGIATACKDPTGNYSPLQYLSSKKTTYQKEPALYRPVLSRDGIITQDFNGDKQPDYVFIEKNRSGKIHLTSCISDASESGYRRTPSGVEMHEYKEGEDIRNYEVSLSYDKLTVSETTLQQPMGAESKVSIYGFDKERESFVLEARNFLKLSSDGATGATSEQYDLVNKTYREALNCNNVPEEFRVLCKPYQRGGKLVLPDDLPTLDDTDPVLFKRKIAE